MWNNKHIRMDQNVTGTKQSTECCNKQYQSYIHVRSTIHNSWQYFSIALQFTCRKPSDQCYRSCQVTWPMSGHMAGISLILVTCSRWGWWRGLYILLNFGAWTCKPCSEWYLPPGWGREWKSNHSGVLQQ